MAHVYVTGHKNPDTDTIASAIGYAEYKNLVDPDNFYAPACLGRPNSQTQWALDKSGINAPKLIRHIMLRVKDVMSGGITTATTRDPLRNVGLVMSQKNISQVPIVDDDGTLVGIITERDLARMYVRESRGASSFSETPVSVGLIVEVLEGKLVAGKGKDVSGTLWVISMGVESMGRTMREGDVVVVGDRKEAQLRAIELGVGVLEGKLVAGKGKDISGTLWVISMGVESMGRTMREGDVVVVGDRKEAQLRAIELGVGVLVISNGAKPEDEVLEEARKQGTSVVLSPLDSYVTSRMIQLSVPCGEVMSDHPLTVSPDELLTDITDRVMEVHYRAAIAVDDDNVPLGVVTRTNLLNPEPRRVILVDHAEVGQSVAGVEEAQVVEILDHHHVGDIQTRTPIAATFDPVGSTATLIIERFRKEGLDPEVSTAKMLLSAILSDTVILNSPTTTDRDHEVVKYLERHLGLDHEEFGMEMFEASSDVSDLTAEEITNRDAKEYEISGGAKMSISQVETVGTRLLGRKDELLEALEQEREKNGYLFTALMVTDIIEQGTELLCAGDSTAVERAFDVEADSGIIDLPGVMSRKKQVAPKLLAAF